MGDVFRRFGPYVARIALRLLGRVDEVEDVVQDVFLAATGSIHQLQEPEAIKGWLAAITVRTCARRLRMRRLKRWFAFDDAPDYERIPAPGANAEQRALLGQVYRALDRVPVGPRVAWTLRYVDAEPLETIAARCDCSVATVKRRIAEAEARLEKEFRS
jgi:RNA polymerase sigma-70 factor (ECF subfamily)